MISKYLFARYRLIMGVTEVVISVETATNIHNLGEILGLLDWASDPGLEKEW